MDQVFAMRQGDKKYLVNEKDVFWTLVDLENIYHTTDQHDMWQMQRV